MTIHNNKGTTDDSASLPRKRAHFTVAASPLNAVKLDLAILIVCAVIMIVLVSSLVTDPIEQVVWLAGYGVLAMLWLVIRARRVVQAWQHQGGQDSDET